METTLVNIADINRNKAWHYELYSRAANEVVERLVNSPHPVVKLKDLAQHGIINRGFTSPIIEQAGIPVLGVRDITHKGIVLDSASYISIEDHEKLRQTQLKKGDVLISLLFRPIAAALYNSDQPANISQHIACMRPNSKVDGAYLVQFLNSGFGLTLMNRFAAVGSVQPMISLKALHDLPILLPPLRKQVQIVQKALDAAEQSQQLLLKSQELFQQAEIDFVYDLLDESRT